MSGKEIGLNVARWWRTWVVILAPILLSPLAAANPSTESSCAYILLLMAIYWVTEALPIAVTSLLPLVLVPFFGIMPAKEISPYYMKDTNCLFIAGLFIAICIENSNLHKRIALRVLLFFGTSPRWLMIGFMLPTWFLSMWISNTATTAMMMPIVNAVLEQMKVGSKETRKESVISMHGVPNVYHNKSSEGAGEATTVIEVKEKNVGYENNGAHYEEERSLPPVEETQCGKTVVGVLPVEPEPVEEEEEEVETETPEDKEFLQLAKAMCLSIAYAANAGGIGTLTGTGPNLALKGVVDDLSGGTSVVIFSTWMAFAVPVSIIVLLLCWMWLQIWFLGIRATFKCQCGRRQMSEKDIAIKNIVRREYNALGPVRFQEAGALGFFIFVALLWLLRKPGFMPGWGELFKDGYVTDATAGMFVAILLFAFPGEKPKCAPKSKPSKPLLTWEIVTHQMPWNVALLLGGGFALAEASKTSGLSSFIGARLVSLQVLPVWAMALIISTMTAGFTEFTSNTATTYLLLPIVSELSTLINLNPLYLMLAVAVAASFAFMFPVATPPNAIVFSYGYIRMIDMAAVGLVMNILCIIVVSLALNTWAYPIFQLDQLPNWVNATVSP